MICAICQRPLAFHSTSCLNGLLEPLGVSGVDKALAWSWLVDIGQGDFLAACIAAKEAFARERTIHTLFARAVVHMLQGEFASAFPLFEEVFQITRDIRQQFVVASVARWAERRRGDVLPDGFSILFADSLTRWQHYELDSLWEQRWQSLRSQVSNNTILFEGMLIHDKLSMFPSYRTILFGSSNSHSQDAMSVKQNADVSILCKLATGRGLHGLSAWLTALYQELIVLDGSIAQQLNVYHRQIAYYRSGNHLSGVANSLLSLGDRLVTPDKGGSPILFGYHLSEPGSPTTTPDDPRLFDRSGVDLAGTRAAYTEALQLFSMEELPRGQAAARIRLAYLDALEGKLTEAKEEYRTAKRQFDALGDILNAQVAAYGDIWTRWRLGEPGLEREVHDLAQVNATNDALSWGLSWGLAFAYAGREALLTRGEVENALRAATLAETIFAALDAPRFRALTCGDREAALSTLEATEPAIIELDTALTWIDQALEQARDEEMKMRIAALTQAQRLVLIYSGQFDAAGLERIQAHIQRWVKDVPEVTLAKVKSMRQRLRPDTRLNILRSEPEAGDEYTRAVEHCLLHGLANVLQAHIAIFVPLSYGQRAMEQGDEAEATKHFQKALTAAQARTDKDLLRTYIYIAWRRYDQARDSLRRYIAAGMPQDNQLPQLYKELDPSSGQPPYEVQDHELAATLFVDIQAWEDARAQLDILTRLQGPPLPLDPLPTRVAISRCVEEAMVAEGLGDYDQALNYIAQAVQGLEARRQHLRSETLRRSMGRQRTTQGIYATWARILIAKGRWDEAFDVAERARARVLVESVQASQRMTQELQSDMVFRRYQEQAALVERLTSQLAQAYNNRAVQQRVTSLQAERTSALTELNKREEQLFQADQRWREVIAPQAGLLSFAQVAAHLPTGTLLLAYLFHGERLFIWAVTRQGLMAHHTVTDYDAQPFIARPFGARIQRCREALGKKDEELNEEQKQFLLSLSKILIEPFDTYITEATHLLIVPFDELNVFPFHVLPWHENPLGAQRTVSYLPSASLLRYLRSSDPAATGALVVGDPYKTLMPTDSSDVRKPFPPIPGTRLTASHVASIYGSQPLVGTHATKDIVLGKIANNPKIIHFATHGYFVSNEPLASGIALAGGTTLSADEVMGLKIKADVVVLGACETGLGELQGSELVGLARSWLYAGARAVIVTLWEVNDLATALLMQILHRCLHGGMPTAIALKQAVDELRQVTVQQALDFCTDALAGFPRQSKEEQAAYATLLCRKGDVLAVGGAYTGATNTYTRAVEIFRITGYTSQAEKLEEIASQYALLASDAEEFQPKLCIFDNPKYWAAFEVIGDWK